METPKCPRIDESIKKGDLAYIKWNTLQLEKRTLAVYDNIDGTRGDLLSGISQNEKDIGRFH